MTEFVKIRNDVCNPGNIELERPFYWHSRNEPKWIPRTNRISQPSVWLSVAMGVAEHLAHHRTRFKGRPDRTKRLWEVIASSAYFGLGTTDARTHRHRRNVGEVTFATLEHDVPETVAVSLDVGSKKRGFGNAHRWRVRQGLPSHS